MTTWNQASGDLSELWGETLQELYDEMNAWNMDEVGRCSWHPVLSLDWGDDQAVTAARLTVDIEVLVPAWARRSEANDAVRAEWDRWSDALTTHEMGHYNLAYQWLDGYEDSLLGTPQTDAWAAFEQRKVDLQQASDAYDTSTNHGISQGTTLDTSIT